jgi:C4-dicarboxylate-specific signal transduction histidine kinase
MERKALPQGATGSVYMAHGAVSELLDVAELIGSVAPNRRSSRRTVDIAAEIAAFETAIVYLLKWHKVLLTVDIRKDAVIRTEMSAALLHQVLHILLWNALDALGKTENRQIRIRLYQTKQGQGCILFEDTGGGVADEIRERIFKPGFTTKPNGGGMGLAIARRLLADAGCTIELQATGVHALWTAFEIGVDLKRSRVTVD